MVNNIIVSSKGMAVNITRVVNSIETNFVKTILTDTYNNVVYIERDVDGLFIYEARNDGSLVKSKYNNYELKTAVTSIKLIKPEDKEVKP